MIWHVGWGQRPVDPWQYLGDEAMVAWDRDMGPHMARIAQATCMNIFSTQDSNNLPYLHRVIFRGVVRTSETWHDAVYYEDPPRWVCSIDGDYIPDTLWQRSQITNP